MTSADHAGTLFIQIRDDSPVSDSDLLIAPSPWAKGPHERLADMDLGSPGVETPIELLQTVSKSLVQLIEGRRRCAELLVVTGSDVATLQIKIDRLWMGCRPHPYSNEQIARSIVSLVTMVKALDGRRISEG